MLRSVTIDIAAGATDYAIESSYKLPVDVEALAVQPHMHYLGKQVHAYAELPTGAQQELILIKRWDFNWQGDYRYKAPIFLPKGSTLRMRYTYDNSEGNVNNPSRPPRRVTYGLDSSDEMGELALQLLPLRADDLAVLKRDFLKNWGLADNIARARAMLRRNPKDAENRTALATSLAASGRTAEAMKEVQQAIMDEPTFARAHYILGQLFLGQNDAPNANIALKRAVELDPANASLQNDLGWVLLASGDVAAAIEHLERAVQLNPADDLARQNLAKARAMAQQGRLKK
jgi:tetratricopeptide (TPR) repeat protein